MPQNERFLESLIFSLDTLSYTPFCYIMRMLIMYGVPSVSKTLTNAIFVYLPLIYKYDTDLAKYLPDLYMGLI